MHLCHDLRMFWSSVLISGDAQIHLIGPLAVVVWACSHTFAPQAHSMLLCHDAAAIVKCNTCILLGAWIAAQCRHALLVRHNVGIDAACTWILLNSGQLLIPCCCERERIAGVKFQEGTQFATNWICCNSQCAKGDNCCLHHHGGRRRFLLGWKLLESDCDFERM